MAGNSIRWNNSKKSKRIENNKSRYENPKTMKNHKKIFAAFIAGFFTGLMIATLTSCQPKDGKEQTVKALFDQKNNEPLNSRG